MRAAASTDQVSPGEVGIPEHGINALKVLFRKATGGFPPCTRKLCTFEEDARKALCAHVGW